MQKAKPKIEPARLWQPTQFQRLFRFVPSGMIFARFKVRGKQVRKSLGTPSLDLARRKLIELEHNEMSIAHERRRGKMLFGEALEEYVRFRRSDPTLKPSTQAYFDQRAKALYESWPDLKDLDIRRISKEDCQHWAGTFRVFSYVQLIGLVWSFLFAVKRIMRITEYEAGMRILVNLVCAKDTMLVNFSRTPGKEGQIWKDSLHFDAMDGGSLQNWRCRDPHFQAEFQCALGSLGQAESKKMIDKCARQLGLAYNHQSDPRCFNYGTDIFPWNQFNPNPDF